MDPLASEEAFEARLARALDSVQRSRAAALLTDASATVRGFTGQTLTRAQTTARFVPRYYQCRWGIVLPQWPIITIDTVVNDANQAVTVNWVQDDFVLATVPLTITYTHGYQPIPDDIVAVVCQVAGRAFGTLPTDAGITSETLTPYAYTIGAAAAAGPMGLLDDEKRALKKYRRPTRPISMVPPHRNPATLDTWT